MKRLLVIAALLTAAAAPPAVAVAQDSGRGSQSAGRQAPLSRVLGMIAQRTPGRHLNTTMGQAGGRAAYFVQWRLPDGRVVVFVVDAESGQIMGQQGG